MMNKISISPIGTITTPFKQKFAIPRQPGLANAKGTICLEADFDATLMLDGISGYSHLWLLFYFHQTADHGWKPKVKAPRLGGNKTTGVLATRSTFRPNALGMSVVKNNGLHKVDGKWVLSVSGVDLLDQTPIVDIKPYLPYADSISDAKADIVLEQAIPNRQVIFTLQAQQSLQQFCELDAQLEQLICAILSQDPRPAYRQKLDNDPKTYRVQIYTLDIAWQVVNGDVKVLAIDMVE